MSGREVFEFNPTLVMEDDDDNEGEVFVHSRSQVIMGVQHAFGQQSQVHCCITL